MVSVKSSEKKRFILVEFQRDAGEPFFVDFDLYKQRHYKTPEIFTEILEYVFNKSTNLYKAYMKIKNLIMTYEVTTEQFVSAIDKFILTEELITIAKQHLDENYNKFEKIKENENNVVNDAKNQLIISEDQIKDLLVISFIMKFVIPIVSDFSAMHRIDIYYDVFYNIMQKNNANEIIEKLLKFIHFRVNGTNFSDKNMWKSLSNINTTAQTFCIELLEKVTVSVLFKLNFSQYPVSLIHVAIKNQIEYRFLEDYDYDFVPVAIYESDDGTSTMDRFEAALNRMDEGDVAINALDIAKQLKTLVKTEFSESIDISKEEMDFYFNSMRLNSFQTNIILLFFGNNFYTLNKRQYVFLLLMIRRWLSRYSQFSLMSKLMTSNMVNVDNQRTTLKKSFLIKLNETKLYDTIRNKFKFMNDKFDADKNPILNIIASACNIYEVFTYGCDNETIDVDDVQEDIAYQILLFISKVI